MEEEEKSKKEGDADKNSGWTRFLEVPSSPCNFHSVMEIRFSILIVMVADPYSVFGAVCCVPVFKEI